MADSADLAGLRRSYLAPALTEAMVADSPLAQFRAWFDDALAAGLPEPNAMTLATVDVHARPATRTVLLKGLDQRGFMFATNFASEKGLHMQGNPAVALTFLWHGVSRQVNVRGLAERAPAAESEAYFRSRPREHQLGAWASRQSEVLSSRDDVQAAYDRLEREFPVGSDVPCPPFWGCVIVVPDTVEFWQGQPSRLHDRIRFARVSAGGLDDANAWRLERLSP